MNKMSDLNTKTDQQNQHAQVADCANSSFRASEFDRIAEIAKKIGETSSEVIVGIGDDAAVLKSNRGSTLLCSDAMVEGVHFDLKYTSATDLGHKSLASCLSDIAAMNGIPRAALFSIAIPSSLPDKFLEDFYHGATSLAHRFGVDIVGGDLTRSPNTIFVDVTCMGEATAPQLRSGAKPGDLLAVSGFPGSSAAGLYCLQHGINSYPRLNDAHLRPIPRFDLLKNLVVDSNSICTAMIDTSDGISSETLHVARQSKVSFEIIASQIPLFSDLSEVAHLASRSALEWTLNGGEDYELLVTLDQRLVDKHGVPNGFTVIGQAISSDYGSTLIHPDGSREALTSRGFDHFRGF